MAAALLLGLLEEGSVGVGGWAACVWLGEAIVEGWLVGVLRIARRKAVNGTWGGKSEAQCRGRVQARRWTGWRKVG